MNPDFDVVVIGSGAAGLMAAIHASKTARTALLTDRAIGKSNSIMAQGGIQLPYGTSESRCRFLADIKRSARGEILDEVVARFVEEVEPTIHELERWGLALDRDSDGKLVRRRAGGLSEARIVSVRDSIGSAIMKVLKARARDSPTELRSGCTVDTLVPGPDRVRVRFDGGELSTKAVVCCTGGLAYWKARETGQRTTNPANGNHGFFAELKKLGAETIDEDVYQYQPFGLVDGPGGGVDKCVPESIVNFDPRLVDKNGDEVCGIRRDRLELTEAIHACIADGRGIEGERGDTGVWLTLGDIPPPRLRSAFPKLYLLLERSDRVGRNVLVRPFLHYYLGGFRIDDSCRSTIPRVFMAGEMVGGIHGRNRLMGNGITDSLVHGRLAGLAAARFAGGD